MTSTYDLRKIFTSIGDWNTSISREDFERHFFKTDERVTFTFNGWDGKSYDGESRTSRVYKTDCADFENARFVKVGKHLHLIMEDNLRIKKATGESHPTASWVVSVRKAG